MKPILKIIVQSISLIFILSHLPVQKVNAQIVTEPPIPVYIVCPYHKDSLRSAYDSLLSANNSALVQNLNKYDTLRMQIQKSSVENTTHFTWLYTFLAFIFIMNIGLLFMISRTRKELAQLRQAESHQKH